MRGLTIMYHTGRGWYFGAYQRGVFSDSYPWSGSSGSGGWGFKIDFFLARILRPVPVLRLLWEKRKIRSIMESGSGQSFFGQQLYALLLAKGSTSRDLSYNACNPWYGKFWFVLDSVISLPCMFVSVSTPVRSFYYGVKTYSVDAGRDDTWRAGRTPGRYGCPSITIRSKR